MPVEDRPNDEVKKSSFWLRLFFFFLLVIFSAFGVKLYFKVRERQLKKRLTEVRVGMTEREVIELLGEPEMIENCEPRRLIYDVQDKMVENVDSTIIFSKEYLILVDDAGAVVKIVCRNDQMNIIAERPLVWYEHIWAWFSF